MKTLLKNKKNLINKIIGLFFLRTKKGYKVIVSINDENKKISEIKGTKLADCPCNIGLACGALV